MKKEHTMKKTIEELARDALAVQNACNLSGVVFGFARTMESLCELATEGGHGTDWKNTHPIAVLWSSKIASLTGSENSLDFSAAYARVTELAV
jgi:hypothetical protein